MRRGERSRGARLGGQPGPHEAELLAPGWYWEGRIEASAASSATVKVVPTAVGKVEFAQPSVAPSSSPTIPKSRVPGEFVMYNGDALPTLDPQAFSGNSAKALSGEARMKSFAGAERILIDEDAAVLPLYWYPGQNLIDLGRWGGCYPNSLDLHPWKFVSPKT